MTYLSLHDSSKTQSLSVILACYCAILPMLMMNFIYVYLKCSHSICKWTRCLCGRNIEFLYYSSNDMSLIIFKLNWFGMCMINNMHLPPTSILPRLVLSRLLLLDGCRLDDDSRLRCNCVRLQKTYLTTWTLCENQFEYVHISFTITLIMGNW